MQSVHRYKIISALIACLLGIAASAQPNKEQYDNRLLHFGFTISMNISSLRVDSRPATTFTDSISDIRMKTFPGIGLGGITNLHLGDYFDVRLMFPVISFSQRNITYRFPNSIKEVKVESAYCDASLLIKYKSARRKNVRAYVIAGPRFSYDLSSTIGKDRSNSSPVVSLKKTTYGYDAGFGLDIYFPYFKFSPEIKVSNTVGNALYYDGYQYTNVIENISPKMVVFSLHFE